MLVPVSVATGQQGLAVGEGWTRRWTVTWRHRSGEVTGPVATLGPAPWAGSVPMRGFTWRRDQRHRPGLEYMVSTGQLHGFESLEEDWLLRALDFCGHVQILLSQPFRMRFEANGRWRRHTPDYLVVSDDGVFVVDVRPAELIKSEDEESFAAAHELSLACGWRYVVAAGWLPHVQASLDAMYARRRPMSDLLNLRPGLLAAAEQGLTFGEAANESQFWPVARAQLLNLLWQRRLGVDLSKSLTNASRLMPTELP
ncbi:TnsA-like heteromeric transposase endonuclease subunit [Streptomyces sp. NPDC097981]|uniref:TnsA-like heteromeric transposase endonuclease subunit n=1 Tax=Streptomyces sp. NPDC097981 TaxID=3155428 RepID=UPI003317343A